MQKTIVIWTLTILIVIIIGVLTWKFFGNSANDQDTLTIASAEHQSDDKKQPPSGFSKSKAAGGGKPVTVSAATVSTNSLPIFQNALGTVTSQGTVTVRSRVDGQLIRVHFEEGQLVKAGDLLAEIDPRPFQAQLAQVQGQALRNQALLENARADLDRYRTLLAQDSIAHQQVDAQKSLVQQYEGTVIADQGLVNQAKLQLSFTKIVAPISGRIGLRQIDNGNNISTADTLTVINQLQPISAVFTLPEDQVSQIAKYYYAAKKSGEFLRVEAWDKGNRTLLATGDLYTLDNQIDSTTGTIKLRALFQNREATLFPNQFVNIRLQLDVLQDVIAIPSKAVLHGSQGPFVYRVAEDNTVNVQPVLTSTSDGENVAILSGLHVGQVVVTSGMDKLREGAKVNIEREESESRVRADNDRLENKNVRSTPHSGFQKPLFKQASK